MKLKYFFFASILLTLLSCASSKDKIANAKSLCADYGFRTGTTEMAICVANENEKAEKKQERFSQDMRCWANSMRYKPDPYMCK